MSIQAIHGVSVLPPDGSEIMSRLVGSHQRSPRSSGGGGIGRSTSSISLYSLPSSSGLPAFQGFCGRLSISEDRVLGLPERLSALS